MAARSTLGRQRSRVSAENERWATSHKMNTRDFSPGPLPPMFDESERTLPAFPLSTGRKLPCRPRSVRPDNGRPMLFGAGVSKPSTLRTCAGTFGALACSLRDGARRHISPIDCDFDECGHKFRALAGRTGSGHPLPRRSVDGSEELLTWPVYARTRAEAWLRVSERSRRPRRRAPPKGDNRPQNSRFRQSGEPHTGAPPRFEHEGSI
jgi:hypothetical protein